MLHSSLRVIKCIRILKVLRSFTVIKLVYFPLNMCPLLKLLKPFFIMNINVVLKNNSTLCEKVYNWKIFINIRSFKYLFPCN